LHWAFQNDERVNPWAIETKIIESFQTSTEELGTETSMAMEALINALKHRNLAREMETPGSGLQNYREYLRVNNGFGQRAIEASALRNAPDPGISRDASDPKAGATKKGKEAFLLVASGILQAREHVSVLTAGLGRMKRWSRGRSSSRRESEDRRASNAEWEDTGMEAPRTHGSQTQAFSETGDPAAHPGLAAASSSLALGSALLARFAPPAGTSRDYDFMRAPSPASVVSYEAQTPRDSSRLAYLQEEEELHDMNRSYVPDERDEDDEDAGYGGSGLRGIEDLHVEDGPQIMVQSPPSSPPCPCTPPPYTPGGYKRHSHNMDAVEEAEERSLSQALTYSNDDYYHHYYDEDRSSYR